MYGIAVRPVGNAGGLARCQALSRHRWRWDGAVWTAVAAALVLVQLSPEAQVWLQFDRVAISAGQAWRLLTGNFVHYGWVHWAANVGAFAALCWIARGRSRGTMRVVMLSALAVGVCIYFQTDSVTIYRGISGIDCALLAWILITMAIQDRGWKAGVWIGVWLLVAGKSACEAVTGQVLLPTSAPAGVAVVGVTHVMGLATGALAAIVIRRRAAYCGSQS